MPNLECVALVVLMCVETRFACPRFRVPSQTTLFFFVWGICQEPDLGPRSVLFAAPDGALTAHPRLTIGLDDQLLRQALVCRLKMIQALHAICGASTVSRIVIIDGLCTDLKLETSMLSSKQPSSACNRDSHDCEVGDKILSKRASSTSSSISSQASHGYEKLSIAELPCWNSYLILLSNMLSISCIQHVARLTDVFL
ncbi:hypothetical protein MRB53_041594 [Persea americana]|nr:hypothetical protein MRB53_041594 [Persea americana]